MNVNEIETQTVDGQILPELTAKVVWIGDVKTTQHGPIQNIGCVDVNNKAKGDGPMIYFGVSNDLMFDESHKFGVFKFTSVSGSHGLQGVKRGSYNGKPQIKITKTCSIQRIGDGGGAQASSPPAAATTAQRASSGQSTAGLTVEDYALHWLACLEVASAMTSKRLGWPELTKLDPTDPQFASISSVVCPLATHLRLSFRTAPEFKTEAFKHTAAGTKPDPTEAPDGSFDEEPPAEPSGDEPF